MVKRVYNGNDVLPAKSAGQIPVAAANGNGRLVYEPVTATLPTPVAADAGKVLAIDTVSATGVTYKYETLTPIDPLILSIYNQSGVLGSVSATFAGKVVSFLAPNLTSVYYNKINGQRIVKGISNLSPITITTTGDATYLFAKPNEVDLGQVHSSTDPADFRDQIYLFKVYHPGGGDIVSIKPVYTRLDQPQENLRTFGYGLGIMAQGFNISIGNTTSGTLYQNGPYAVVSGYNINPYDNIPSQRVFPVVNTGTGITFQYWAWTAADRLPAQNTVYGTYKLDNPITNTSTALPNFGIVLMFAGSDGSYIFLAPQTNYTTLALAEDDVLNYSASVIVPQLLIEQYDVIGALVVPGTFDTAAATAGTFKIIMLNSIAVGGAPKDSLLPAPSTAGVVKVLAGSNAFSIQPDTPAPVVDLTGFVDGDVVGVRAGKIAPIKTDVLFPSVAFQDAKRGYFRLVGNTVSHIAGDLVNAGITIVAAPSTGQITGTQITFTASNNIWLHGGFYETAKGQSSFYVYSATPQTRFANALVFAPSDPITFSDNTQGFEFSILYFLS